MRKTFQILKLASSLLRYKIGSPKPIFASYQLNRRCNKRCIFCDGWKLSDSKELDTTEAKKVVTHLAEGGVRILGITGGEPTLRTDLEEIGLHAKSEGMIVAINTNGSLLSLERAKSLTKAFDTIFVSLDGFEETHDSIRGVKGTFRQTMLGISNLLSVRGDCVVGVNFVLTKANVSEFLPLCDYLTT